MKKERYRRNGGNNNSQSNFDYTLSNESIDNGVIIAENLVQLLLNENEIANYSKEMILALSSTLIEVVSYNSMMTEIFFSLLQSLEQDDLFYLLNISNLSTNKTNSSGKHGKSKSVRIMSLPNCIGFEMQLKPLSQSWNSVAIAKMIENRIYANHDNAEYDPSDPTNEYMNILQLQLLYAAVKSHVEQSKPQPHGSGDNFILSNQWLEIYQNLKNDILHGFSSSKTILIVIEIVTFYLFHSSLREMVFNDSKFQELIKQLYTPPTNASGGSGNDASGKSVLEELSICQYLFERFLRDSYKVGKPFNTAILQLVNLFAKNFSSIFTNSTNLIKLQKEFSSQINN